MKGKYANHLIASIPTDKQISMVSMTRGSGCPESADASTHRRREDASQRCSSHFESVVTMSLLPAARRE